MNKPTDNLAHEAPETHQGNPLIAEINGFPHSMKQLYAAVARVPDEPTDRQRGEDKLVRVVSLATVNDLYVPSERDLEAATTVVAMLLKGLTDRSPCPKYWSQQKVICAALGGVGNRGPGTGAASLAIIGVSGTGKTSAMENLLNSIPQVVEHDQVKNPLLPRHQVVWLKVTCPVNRTPRGFITQFFAQIDELLGTTYQRAHARENDDQMIASMGSVARTHFLGVLVIDEIQNAVGASKDTERRLLKLFVNITGILRVPIVFVGTPKSQEVMNSELAHARRMFGPRWMPYAAEDPEWRHFLEVLWKYQFTRTCRPLDDALRATVHDLTQGIPALAKALFVLTQKQLILHSVKEDKEIITPELLRATFERAMKSVAGAIHALRMGKSHEVYDDLLPKTLPKPSAWNEEMAKLDGLAKSYYEDAMTRRARQLGRQRAEELAAG
jgi:hypothetical protein